MATTPTLTPQELAIMKVVWRLGSATVRDVHEVLRREHRDDLAYTTVLTILRTLEQKGYVKHEEEGRVHRYYAAVKQDAARKSALKHLTGKLFKGSAELLFTHLVSDKKLSAEQLQRMRELLTKMEK